MHHLFDLNDFFSYQELFTKQNAVLGFCLVSEHVDDIITHIFQYINLLQKERPQLWIFRECQVCLSTAHTSG